MSGREAGVDLKGDERWRVALVVSRFNSEVTRQLLEGARAGLLRAGLKESQLDVFWVPGAFEIPPAARRIVAQGVHDGLICLGAVIRGATPHFEYVAGEAARGIATLACESSVPVIFSVLTTDNLEQAMERAGVKDGKGYDGALALVEMIHLYGRIAALRAR